MAPEAVGADVLDKALPFRRESPWWSREVEEAFATQQSLESFAAGLVSEALQVTQCTKQVTAAFRRMGKHLRQGKLQGVFHADGSRMGLALCGQLGVLGEMAEKVADAQAALEELLEGSLGRPLKAFQQAKGQRLAELRKQTSDALQAHESAVDHKLHGSSSMALRCTSAEAADDVADEVLTTFASAELARQELSAAVSSNSAAAALELSEACSTALGGLQAYCASCGSAGAELEPSLGDARSWQQSMHRALEAADSAYKVQRDAMQRLCRPVGGAASSAASSAGEDAGAAADEPLPRCDAFDGEDEPCPKPSLSQALLTGASLPARAMRSWSLASRPRLGSSGGRTPRTLQASFDIDADMDLPHFRASLEALYAPRVSPPTHEGYLWRRLQASARKSQWARCWFYLEGSQLQFLQKSPGACEPTFVCDCQLATVRESLGGADGAHFAFELILASGRSHFLQAESQQELEGWIGAIRGGILRALEIFDTPRVASPAAGPDSRAVADQDALPLIGEICQANPACADCSAAAPDWVTLTFGGLLCIDCAGVHRSLGAHISKVRSLKLDVLPAESYAALRARGNELLNAELEAEPPADSAKPSPTSSRESRERWIRAKYVSKDFVATAAGSPESGGSAAAEPQAGLVAVPARPPTCGEVLSRLASSICSRSSLPRGVGALNRQDGVVPGAPQTAAE